jgi:hypothetical protein
VSQESVANQRPTRYEFYRLRVKNAKFAKQNPAFIFFATARGMIL